MDDVRHQLHRHLAEHIGGYCVEAMDWGQVADAILERFDVTPKAAIDPYHLGLAVRAAAGASVPEEHVSSAGCRLLESLNSIGLQIVRVSE